MSRELRELVPPPKSRASTSAVDRPRHAASRAIAAPWMPPPITSRSKVLPWSSRGSVRNARGLLHLGAPSAPLPLLFGDMSVLGVLPWFAAAAELLDLRRQDRVLLIGPGHNEHVRSIASAVGRS